MGNSISADKIFHLKVINRGKNEETSNTRVAMWHLPYDERYSNYDTDGSFWFESNNKYGENEIENAEKNLHISLNKYKVYTKTMEYSDDSVAEISKYPNGNKVKVSYSSDYVFASIRDKTGKIVAEKCYNYSSHEGRKTVYKHYTQGNNTFTVIRVFSYDTSNNLSSDIVNYGYKSNSSDFIRNATLEKEYYMLDGEQVSAELNNKGEYCVKNKQGKMLIFSSAE